MHLHSVCWRAVFRKQQQQPAREGGLVWVTVQAGRRAKGVKPHLGASSHDKEAQVRGPTFPSYRKGELQQIVTDSDP